MPVREFLKAVKRERETIFHRDDVPPLTNQSQKHSVCLQMIVRGILALKVKDATKLGMDKLNGALSCVICPTAKYAVSMQTGCVRLRT